MHTVYERISEMGIVPVIKITDVSKAVPLAKALCDGGLSCAEVTFRTAQAEAAIREITKAMPDMLVGAGTVLTTAQVDAAVDAGATFMVSPGLNPNVVRYCLDKGIPILPGCSTPSDIEQALALGLSAVKFFPAEAAGGLEMVKAMSAPYGDVKFVPTGGIGPGNLLSYLGFNKVLACGGSWMVKEDLIAAGEFDKITAMTRDAIDLMLGFELAHIGINTASVEEATECAGYFAKLFGFAGKEGNSSVFAGKAVEAMKAPYLGVHGHIAIKTNFIKRALYYLQTRGAEIDMDTAKYDARGNMAAVYLKGEINGFAVHLVQK